MIMQSRLASCFHMAYEMGMQSSVALNQGRGGTAAYPPMTGMRFGRPKPRRNCEKMIRKAIMTRPNSGQLATPLQGTQSVNHTAGIRHVPSLVG